MKTKRDYRISGDSKVIVVHYFDGFDSSGACIPAGIKIYKPDEYDKMKSDTTKWLLGKAVL